MMRPVLAAIVCVFTSLDAQAGDVDTKALDASLAAIARGEESGNPLAGAVIAVRVGERLVYTGAAGCAAFDETPEQRCARKLKVDTKVRVASISKMATAMVALELEKEARLDLDRDVSDYLGWPLRNPAFPETPITARQLMTHLSSLRDPEEYWVSAPGAFRALIERTKPFAAADGARSNAPGAFFTYANINYGVLASVLEQASGERFDKLVSSRVLAPLKLDAGFNWSGVSAKARRRAATLYRTENGRWAAQTDGSAILSGEGPLFLTEDGLDDAAYLSAYVPGANATLFSPQGGLRASVLDLLTILDARGAIDIVWRFDPKAENGDTQGGFYPAAGLGALAIKGDETIWPGAELVGHSGEAYGLMAGLWRVRGEDKNGPEVSFAYAITGAANPPLRGAHGAFYDVEEPLLRLAMAAAAEAGAVVDDEPRPFDFSRDAMSDVDAALAAAMVAGKNVLLILGGDWCHDSRAFAMRLADPGVAAAAARYEVVYVDVGHRDRNLDVPKRFAVTTLLGTPTILVLSGDGKLLNRATMHDWRNASERSAEELKDYLLGLVDQARR